MKKKKDLDETLRKTGTDEIPSDVLGSYKGQANDGGKPEQDADDL